MCAFFLFALLIAAASAFVAPSTKTVSTRTAFSPRTEAPSAPKMMAEGSDVAVSNFAENANVIASNVGDFGGYLFPVFGILALSALILYLAPPLGDVE
mmetsp:Transcript_9475/g.13201  ORF Transcript_9475/g.13201 Transcript_9475/m.13201 type:complete len:98 (-) Transcript_9475:267-560(-)